MTSDLLQVVAYAVGTFIGESRKKAIWLLLRLGRGCCDLTRVTFVGPSSHIRRPAIVVDCVNAIESSVQKQQLLSPVRMASLSSKEPVRG